MLDYLQPTTDQPVYNCSVTPEVLHNATSVLQDLLCNVFDAVLQ